MSDVGAAAGAEPVGCMLDELDMLLLDELLSPGGGVSVFVELAAPESIGVVVLMLLCVELSIAPEVSSDLRPHAESVSAAAMRHIAIAVVLPIFVVVFMSVLPVLSIWVSPEFLQRRDNYPVRVVVAAFSAHGVPVPARGS